MTEITEISAQKRAAIKTALTYYALLAGSFFLAWVPHIIPGLIAVILFFWAFIGAYIIRGRNDADSFLAHHMTFLIRTVWIGSLFSLITVTAGGIYMLTHADVMAFSTCIVNTLSLPDMTMIEQETYRCIDGFIALNKGVLLVSVLISAPLPCAYVAYRLIRGALKARHGMRLLHGKSWL